MGLFPRRVSIYLTEKDIVGVERIAFDALASWPAGRLAGWPPAEMTRLSPAATVPILETEDGTLIRSSIAILEYLEERFPTPDMLGATPKARARTRELIGIIDEAANYFATWSREGSPLYARLKQQNREVAVFAADSYYRRLKLLDMLMQETDGPFMAGPHITIADCVGMATLQFAENFYGVPVPECCPKLASWYAFSSSRPSATPPGYPEPLQVLARGLRNACPPTPTEEGNGTA